MRDIILKNAYYTYAMSVTGEGHLQHEYFLPSGSDLHKSRTLKNIYPYEVVLSFAESKPIGWRFGDEQLNNEASHNLIFRDVRREGDSTVVTLYQDNLECIVELVYVVHADSPAIQRYTRIKNCGDKALELQHISSFTLSGFPYNGKSGELFLHSYASAWALEGEEHVNAFTDLGLLAPGCRSGWSFQNLSVFSTQKKFPYFVVEERESKLFWGVQLECGSQWHAAIAGGDIANPDWFLFQGGLPNFSGGLWSKTLKPGEIFETPRASLTVAKGRIDSVYNQMHVHQRKYFVVHPKEDKCLNVIFNDWQAMRGNVSESIIRANLDVIEKLGADIYVTDSGWYHGDGQDWSEYVGCWTPNVDRFPNGLKPVVDDIRRHNMIAGIWCEIEMVGPHSEHYDDLQMLLCYHNKPITQWHRRFLDFRKEKARIFASRTIQKIYEEGFRYLKIDYNADCSPACDGEDSPIENLRQARLAYGMWLQDILSKYPDLILEHCASGGMKLDYDNLTRGSLASITDQWNNLHTGSIFANVSKLVDPTQCENWSTLKPEMSAHTIEFTLINSMIGRLCISGKLDEFTEEQRLLVKNAISFYKRYRYLIEESQQFLHSPSTAVQTKDSLKAIEYLNDNISMLWISAHDFEGTFTCSPVLGSYTVEDAYPSQDGLVIKDKELMVTLSEEETFGCILILKKNEEA